MSLKEKINNEMVFPKEVLKEANEIFKALPTGLKSVTRHHLIIEKLERHRLWNLISEIIAITKEFDENYNYDSMDEMDALEHFQKYHEKISSILSKGERS